jgi:uncharacterized protein YdeI (YjbR/CyaY-like superfamily)
MKPTFFATAAEFRRWLKRHGSSATELWVGYHKKSTGRPSLTWQESVDEALCFGWIDGVRKSVDEHSYTNRFTPRRRGSGWSAINIARARRLIRAGRMQPAGLRAFKAHDGKKARALSDMRKNARLTRGEEADFRANRKAWAFFELQPPGYRKLAAWFVVSAKRADTRARRLATLIGLSESGRRLEPMRPADAVR